MAGKIEVKLDTSKEIYESYKCKQNDDLLLIANIYENGTAKDLTNCSIVVQAKKADNTYIIQNTDINKLDKKFEANLVKDFTRVAGETKIEVVLVESGKQNTTFSFCLEVVESVIKGAEESKDLITSLEKMQDAVVEMGKISDETKELIENSGAASKEEINKVNASLAEIKKQKLDESIINKDIGLRNWDLQFARATSLSNSLPKPCAIFVGDSITASAGADNYEAGYVNLLKNSIHLATGYTGKGFRGYSEFVNKAGWTQLLDKGTNHMCWSGIAGATTITFTELCNKVDIIYARKTDGGSFDISFDGQAVTVNSNGQESYHNVITRDMGVNEGFHTITINPPTSGKAYIEGLVFYAQQKGVIIHQLGHPGIQACSYLNNPQSIKATIGDFSPSLTVLALGTNDCIQQKSLNDYKASLEQLANEAKKTGDVLILSMPLMVGGDNKAIPYSKYVEVAKKIAIENDYVHVNMYEKWNKSEDFLNKFNLLTDGVHPSQGGHNSIAETLRNVIGGYYLDGFAKMSNSRLKLKLGEILPADIKIGNRGQDVGITTGATSTTISLTDAVAYGTLPYSVSITPNWNTTYWVTSKGYASFVVNFGTQAPSGAKIDWMVQRN